MPRTFRVRIEGIGLGATLWDVEQAARRMKEIHPKIPLPPTILIMNSEAVVAEIYESGEGAPVLVVHSSVGFKKIELGRHDSLSMLYRTSVLTLEKMEGTAVIFVGEKISKDVAYGTVCAMKWTSHQFLQPLPPGAPFPETQDSISQCFCLENGKVRWLSDANTAQQFFSQRV